MAAIDDIGRAIRQKDIEAIVSLMFERDMPCPKTGFRTETNLWDYKSDCPKLGKESGNAWAELAKDVLAFHNAQGGIIFFGIRDTDFSFCGATTRLDSKLVNDQLRKYISDNIWVDFHREFIQSDQRFLGVVLIPSRGPILGRFRGDAPEINGKRLFKSGDSALRENDSSRVLKKSEADTFSRTLTVPLLDEIYSVNEPFCRILSPEYGHFVQRRMLCEQLEQGLHDPRTSVTALIGIGGVGKTALATWGVLRAYDRKTFNFIVSITAKDREMTSAGIKALDPGLTSFETLLDNILDVLGFPELKATTIEEKEKEVRSLIENSNGLLFVDNLETVDDARILHFLDTLPVGVRAIVTSRRAAVRVSVYPIEVGPLIEDEADEYIFSLSSQPSLSYVTKLSKAERRRIGLACDGVPLAIRWALSRSKSASEALAVAESITGSERKGEEILEFCFRRVFDTLSEAEKVVVEILSLFQRPVSTEVLLAGSRLPSFKVLDGIEDLIADALIQRLFDHERNDYCFTLLPIARAFIYSQISQQPEVESRIRKQLSDWFEAKDVSDLDDRLVIRSVRQGKESSESALVDLAVAAGRRGDIIAAEDLYKQALVRNPRSWRAARLYGEFLRHQRNNIAAALKVYEQAAANAPTRGSERALIFREWGMLLRDSGDPQATDLAISKFETALAETPNDAIASHALAHMFDRKGAYRRVIEVLEPLASHTSKTTRQKTMPLLLKAYEKTNELIKAANLRLKIEDMEQGR